ncbi:hypothetical protein GCM10010123_18190 [Pilimelia anulata]|uniref:Uncharacterized protein n=1 Tax=Pilimelia anulata TaxID=53371 RepID=A0A8J3B8W2_9ACTN|nr:hypothetical protein [Pilimelia anulata]GGJ88970.1 hypothetical protein GCM10010123_18190 [Pilimelia anulata]
MVDVALWVPLASGVLGIMGALAGTALAQRSARHREDRRWARERELDGVRYERERLERRRERRTDLYVDLAEFAQTEQSRLTAATDEYSSRHVGPPELQHPDRLAARVKLYAAPQVHERWTALVRAMDRVRWAWREGDLQHSEHAAWLDHDNPAVVELDRAIDEMHSALKAAIDEEA